MRRVVIALLVLACGACTGLVEDRARGPRGTGAGPRGADVRVATTAIPRLSVREVDATLRDVLGVDGAAARHLPPDPLTAISRTTGAEEEVFDTDALTKTPSQVFVEGLEAMSFEVAREVAADPARLAALAPCFEASPAPEPAACLGELARTLALRLWRRPIESDEESALVARAMPFVDEAGLAIGARLVVQSVVQSPELVYRVEIGDDVGGGLRRLDRWELLSRIAYFLWGSAPSAALLERIAALPPDAPLDDATVAELAREMASDPRADGQMRRFHRLWLRYDRMLVTDPALAADMRAESDALVERALFEEGRSWRDVFASDETFVTPALAAHYGFSAPPASGAEWVPYEDGERAGLLSHGSFLSLSSTRGTETLPSRRGAMIARRILCVPILPPPPDVDIDDGVEVAPGACKSEAYEAHRSRGSCAGCHALIDGIGFGLERLDGLGRHRTSEEATPTCAIEGSGSYGGDAFRGPRELVALADGRGELARCGVAHVVRFAQRRAQASDDAALVDRLHASFERADHDFRELMIAVVLDPAFRLRREEEAP